MILDGCLSGLYSGKQKTTPLTQAFAKRKRNINGGSWNDDRNARGETVYMPEAFGIKSGKSPNFGRIKASKIYMNNSKPEFAIFERILSNEIQFFMAMSDEEVENHVPNSRIKERVHKIGEYEIHIYSRDHDPPHFHVKSKDGSLNARFRIVDGSLISQHGDLRSSVLKRISLWYRDIKTQTILEKIWNKRNG